MCYFSWGKGCGHERGGEQMQRRRRGVGRTRKRDAERNCMAPLGQGAVAVRIFTGFSISALVRKVYAATILVSVLGQESGLVPSKDFPKPPFP